MVFTILISGMCFICNQYAPICSMIIAKLLIMHNSTPFVTNPTVQEYSPVVWNCPNTRVSFFPSQSAGYVHILCFKPQSVFL